MSVRRIVALFAAALVVAAAGYGIYWFHVAGSLRKGLERWADQRRAEGWTVAWDVVETGGFPLHLRLDLAAPRVTHPTGASWRTDRLVAHAEPFDWTRLRLDAPGLHHLAWPGGEATVEAATAQAQVNTDRHGRLEDATLLLSTVTVTGATAEPLRADGVAVTWDPLVTVNATHTTPIARFSTTVHGVTLPALPGLPLDRAIGLVEVTGHVLGEVPAAPPIEALARWSADGGTVELDHVSLEWAPMALEAQGTLALDPAGQPLASLAAKVRGFGPLMDRLTEAGTVPADTANAAKMVLSLMARPDSKGRPAVPVPISVQDGALYLGPAQVARMPPVNWR
ncbi:MAG: DUF2125 domain-containing protein [Magnetospirillum sp.]|nr:DUF2125 domain-containing protein [Magnetospirillum sp.]